MPRLIDADALTEHFRLHVVLAERRGVNESIWAWQGAILDVEDMPTIDAEPVRHGRWELETSKYLRRCSACEKVTFYCGAGRNYDYCPNCGAKMDLEVQDEQNV